MPRPMEKASYIWKPIILAPRPQPTILVRIAITVSTTAKPNIWTVRPSRLVLMPMDAKNSGENSI